MIQDIHVSAYYGVAMDAISQVLEYEDEWGEADYEPHELEAKLALLNEAYEAFARADKEHHP